MSIFSPIAVDKASVELRRLDLQFVNVPGVPADRSGQMDFVRMRDGTWAISRWSAHIPVVARVEVGRSTQLHVVAVKVDGGELALARRGTIDEQIAHAFLKLRLVPADRCRNRVQSGVCFVNSLALRFRPGASGSRCLKRRRCLLLSILA